MCNPVGYDRLKRLYIQEFSLAWRPIVVHFCAVLPRLIHDIWELIFFFTLNFDLAYPNLTQSPSSSSPA